VTFVYPDRNAAICKQILAVIRNWSRDEDPECRPSALCYAVAESGVCTYHECSPQLAILLQKEELRLEPNTPILGEASIKYNPGKPGLYIPSEES
jgi:hypothetical protein